MLSKLIPWNLVPLYNTNIDKIEENPADRVTATLVDKSLL
jgi:hypothetical protein